MTGCCVPDCNNSSKKGFIMKRFPKNPARRALWAACISRLNWTPTDNTYICEVHFLDDMWETTRVDSKKKLKLNAIPTLFPNYVVKRESLVEEKDENKNKNECEAIDVADDENKNRDEYEATNVAEDKNEYEATNVAEDKNEHEAMNVIEDENEILTVAVSQNVQDENNTNSNILVKKYQRLIRAHKVMKNKFRQQQAKFKKLEKKLKDDKNRKMLEKVFNSDQIEFLERDGRKIKSWSAVTIKKALKLRFTCENNGYEELIKQNIPLPCLRTLRKRLEHVQFHNSIDDKIFDYLKLKVDGFKDNNDKECMLTLDEMAIMPGTLYDVSSHTMIGNTTLPNNTGNVVHATHALVFMIAGISSRWKQTVGYYFTSDSYDGSLLKPIILQIIKKAHAIGLYINSVTSDMGPVNMAMWKAFDIHAGRHSTCKFYCQHPEDPQRKLFFIADVPHILKNLKCCLANNKIIELPLEFVDKYKLTSNLVKWEHFIHLVALQDNLDFLLTPRINKDDVQPSGHFNKMKVCKAKNLLSRDVSSSLYFLANEESNLDFNTTACFVEVISKWFALMTSRNPTLALSKYNENKYEECRSFLLEVVNLFQNLRIGEKGHYKPVQTGVIISTNSILHLTDYLLSDKAYKFVLTGRFSQDCLENLFSVIRSKNVIPTALQFKDNLKLISTSQYIKTVEKSNYDQDDSHMITEFLNNSNSTKKQSISEECNDNELFSPIPHSNTIVFNNIELNVLYNIAGYIIANIKKNMTHCDNCISSVGSKKVQNVKYNNLVLLRRYKIETLFFVKPNIFDFFVKMETIFRNCFLHIKIKTKI